MKTGEVTNIDCPHCKLGIVHRYDTKFYCEDCTKEVKVINPEKLITDILTEELEKAKNKKQEIDYIVCDRCEQNNWDDPDFWGCPRGFCEAETKGKIIRKLKIKK